MTKFFKAQKKKKNPGSYHSKNTRKDAEGCIEEKGVPEKGSFQVLGCRGNAKHLPL